MAITFTKSFSTADYVTGKCALGANIVTGLLNIGNSYATGGIAPAASDFLAGATVIRHLQVADSADGIIFYRWLEATGKVMAFDAAGATAAEESAAADLSPAGKSFQVTAYVY